MPRGPPAPGLRSQTSLLPLEKGERPPAPTPTAAVCRERTEEVCRAAKGLSLWRDAGRRRERSLLGGTLSGQPCSFAFVAASWGVDLGEAPA